MITKKSKRKNLEEDMMKKLICTISMLLMMSLLLGGCKSNNSGTKEDTSLADIKAAGELKLGLDTSFPPMGFKDDDNNIVGFDLDLAKEVCKRMGVTLKIVPVDWKAKDQELKTKNVDCLWNGFTKSKDREEKYTLSSTYMNNKQVVVVLKESPVQTLEDLKGKSVIIQNGSTASIAIDENVEFKDSLKEIIKVDDNVQALMDLKTSGSDAVVLDEVVARYYTEKDADTYRVLDTALANEEYVIGFRKGETSLCKEVETYLSEMKQDGTLKQISEKWFGKDITVVK